MERMRAKGSEREVSEGQVVKLMLKGLPNCQRGARWPRVGVRRPKSPGTRFRSTFKGPLNRRGRKVVESRHRGERNRLPGLIARSKRSECLRERRAPRECCTVGGTRSVVQ